MVQPCNVWHFFSSRAKAQQWVPCSVVWLAASCHVNAESCTAGQSSAALVCLFYFLDVICEPEWNRGRYRWTWRVSLWPPRGRGFQLCALVRLDLLHAATGLGWTRQNYHTDKALMRAAHCVLHNLLNLASARCAQTRIVQPPAARAEELSARPRLDNDRSLAPWRFLQSKQGEITFLPTMTCTGCSVLSQCILISVLNG